MKHHIKLTFLALVIATVMTACVSDESDPPPTTPIFPNLAPITLVTPHNDANLSGSGNTFTYNAPSEAEFLVFGLFDAAIVTENGKIKNETNFKYGSRSGMADFARGSQAKAALHEYDAGTKNFKTATATVTNGTYYWAVWGYDKHGNLTHSSTQWRAVIN